MIGYVVDINWYPNEYYVNLPIGGDYIAWRIGENKSANKALWIFGKVNINALPLSNYLPTGYTQITISEDITKYGYTKVLYPNMTYAQFEAEFLALIPVLGDTPVAVPPQPVTTTTNTGGSSWKVAIDNFEETPVSKPVEDGEPPPPPPSTAAGYEYKIVGGAPVNMGNNLQSSVTGLPEGTYTVRVRSYDANGNYSRWSDPSTITT